MKKRTNIRKRPGRNLAVLMAAAIVLATGCHKYEPLEVNAATDEKALVETRSPGADQEETSQAQETPDYSGGPGVVSLDGSAAGESGAENGTVEPLEISEQETEAVSEVQTEAETEAEPEFTETDETVYAAGDNVNVRTSWSTSSPVAGVLQKGEAVKRTGASQDWSRVVYKDQICYVASELLSADQPETEPAKAVAEGEISLNPAWKYADFSKINSGTAKCYKAPGSNRKGITVCVNAGHGTKGGASVKTLCHPDGTPKITSGSTAAGATTAAAVSGGMTFSDGTPEAKVTLALAMKLKEKLLAAGYDVVMIRESDDAQLDNVARTVIANNTSDCHIALHWDSSTNNKGAFYMSVPNVASYRNMEPVKSCWQKHHALGENLVAGLKNAGVKIFSNGAMAMDLTQTSYSTIPSVDIELGDKVSDHSDSTMNQLADGLLAGINSFFGQ